MNDTKTDAKAIFLDALECRGADELRRFLDQACGTDPALGARVEELLRAHQDAGAFLGGAPQQDATRDQLGAERPGTMIGPYKLLEQIGEGGFGLVFMAEQQQPVRRKVAVKVLKPGMDTRQVVARFEAERQALALMDHPSIAKVLDAGTTNPSPKSETRNSKQEGATPIASDFGFGASDFSYDRPYFVMELVKGASITTFCDLHRLTPRERLELFIPVCQAVQHAHQKGIIHRDLKPSNILVAQYDGRPVPKVIDFGVAKAAGQQLTDKTLVTGFGSLIGTLEYMSPEQAEINQLDIDTRSDIYSLGVVLYELLTGSTPLDRKRLKQAAFTEMLRIIREDEPQKPSTRLLDSTDSLPTISAQRHMEAAKLTRSVRGELDWIVMRALEKDRSRRYETANGLAMDIQHYLADEAVQACPPSAWYRFRKFARRNETALATTGLILLFIVFFGIAVGWMVRDRASRDQQIARDRSAREAALDAEANRAINEARSLIRGGRWPEALAVIERTEAVLVTAGRQRDLAPPGLLELDKDLAMARRLEEIHSRPGRGELTREKQTGEFGASRLAEYDILPMTEEIFSGQEVAAAYAGAFEEYGIDVAVLPAEEAAQRIHGRSIRLELARALDFWSSMRRRAGKTGPPDWKRLLAVAKLADPDPWRKELRDALQRRDRKALEAVAATADVPSLSPATLHLLGYALSDVGAAEHAVSLLRQAQRQYPGDLWLNDALAWFCYSALRPPLYDESVRFYTAALAIRPLNPHMTYSIGRALRAKGSLAEAIAEFTKAIELKPDLRDAWWGRADCYAELRQPDFALANFTKVIELDSKYAEAWCRRAYFYVKLGQYDKAIADYRKVIELDSKHANAWHCRGVAYQNLGQLDKAIADYSRAVELEPDLPHAWWGRASCYAQSGVQESAVADYTKAIELDPKQPKLFHNRGLAFEHLGQHDKAIADYTKAIELDPKLLAASCARGTVYGNLGKYDKAIADYSKTVELDPKHWHAWLRRGWTYAKLGQYDKAIVDYSRALELDPKDAQSRNNRGAAYEQLAQYEKAVADYTKAIELDPTSVEYRRQRGAAHANLGEYDKAVADYTKATEMAPKFADVHNQVAWGLVARRDLEVRHAGQAVNWAKKAVELAPKNGAFWNTLGVAYCRAGDWNAALAALEKSMELRKGGDSADWFFCAMAHEKLGDKHKAGQWYDRATLWKEKNKPTDGELVRFKAEAAELLGLDKKRD